jgi:hypothetical protein
MHAGSSTHPQYTPSALTSATAPPVVTNVHAHPEDEGDTSLPASPSTHTNSPEQQERQVRRQWVKFWRNCCGPWGGTKNAGQDTRLTRLVPVNPTARHDEPAATTAELEVSMPAAPALTVTTPAEPVEASREGEGVAPIPEAEQGEPSTRRKKLFVIGPPSVSSTGDNTSHGAPSLAITPYYSRRHTPSQTHGASTPVRQKSTSLDQIVEQWNENAYVTRTGRYFPSIDAVPRAEREAFLNEHDPVRRYGLTRDSVFYRAMEKEWVTDDSRVFGYPDSIAVIHNHLTVMKNPTADQYGLTGHLRYLPVLMPAKELPQATRNVYWARNERDALGAARSYLRAGMVLISVKLGDLMDAGYGVPFHDAVAMRNIPGECVPMAVTWPDEQAIPVRIIE